MAVRDLIIANPDESALTFPIECTQALNCNERSGLASLLSSGELIFLDAKRGERRRIKVGECATGTGFVQSELLFGLTRWAGSHGQLVGLNLSSGQKQYN